MIVEDEPDLYEMLLSMTQIMGVSGLVFANGEEADEWIADVESGVFGGELPELALLDIRLPGSIDGPMVGARLRACPPLSKMRIFLMTAYKLSPSEEKEVLKLSGAETVLYKPLPSIDKLAEILKGQRKPRRWLSRKLDSQPRPNAYDDTV
ncbi:MAG: response regulator [Aggregatilineales bacterium]